MLNNQREPTSSFGSLGFTNALTQQNALTASASPGNAFASFLLGYPASGSVLNNQAMAYSSHYYAGFVQDVWRVSSKLTLNLGVRWDYESPITDRYNRLEAGFDPNAANPLQVPGLPLKGGLLFVTPRQPPALQPRSQQLAAAGRCRVSHAEEYRVPRRLRHLVPAYV